MNWGIIKGGFMCFLMVWISGYWSDIADSPATKGDVFIGFGFLLLIIGSYWDGK